MSLKNKMNKYIESSLDKIIKLLNEADAVFIGAGAGMSTAAGFTYEGERFNKYFFDFAKKYNINDMYFGGFYPYKTDEEKWAYWSRYIYINRYMDASGSIYKDLFQLVKDKEYFVLTTNVDHCFQKAGFDKNKLFYTQGDYGLWQCSEPCHNETYSNEEIIREMLLAQGFTINSDGALKLPNKKNIKNVIPKELVPHCPKCGKLMSMNLRADSTFVQDKGWDIAAQRYEEFVNNHKECKILYIEIGVGFNTPSIIKYNFWKQVYDNPKAAYVCLNMNEAAAPIEIENRSICINGDSQDIVSTLLRRSFL